MKSINLGKYTTKFYIGKLKNCTSFHEVPFTTKEELVLSQKENPPYGNFTDDNKSIYQIYRTSGTSSIPLLLSFTKKDIELITDIGADCFRYSGMGDCGNEEIVINCLNLSLWAGGFLDSQAMMKTGVQVINFGTGNTAELLRLILTLNKKYKVSLHCTPSYLPIIEQKLNDEYHKKVSSLKLHALYLGAEGGIQNHSFRNQLMKTWKCKVYNANYGMSEVCSIMASANDNNVLKYSGLFLKHYFVELLLENGKLIPLSKCKPNDIGDVVVTSLHKESQPLLRYHTKEKIKIISVDKENIFFEVIGRSDNMIVYKGINIFPEQFQNLINKFPELTGFYRLKVQKEDLLVKKIYIECELKDTFHDKNTSEIKQKLAKKIKEQFSVRLEVQLVKNIKREGNKMKILTFI